MNKHLIAVLICCLFFIGCKDNKVDTTQYDPSQPIVFTDFTPKSGGMRTRLYIEGRNFGSDPAKVHITIGGEKAKTIGVDGTIIYCMVPPKAFDGNINVRVDGPDGNVVTDYTFEEKFKYTPATIIGTMLRRVDEDGNSPWQEGSFDEGASLPSNDCLVFDPKYKEGDDRLLFSANWVNGLHLVNLTQRTVKRLFPRTGYNKMYSFTFTMEGDTLLFTDDHGYDGTTRANIYYALRRENFRRIRPYNYGRTSYSVICMNDGTVFYSVWWNGKVYKMVRNGDIPNVDSNAEEQFSLSAISNVEGSHSILIKHPSNKFIYLISNDVGAVIRSNYNEETKTFDKPTIVAGVIEEKGCQEGVGTSARFNTLWNGVFVKNEDYGEGVGPDKNQYDFYVCDKENHCIWKIDPYGIATIIAGRSNRNADGKVKGYVDGAPLHEARFDGPAGLAYDPINEIFYIGDINNKAIRYMTTE